MSLLNRKARPIPSRDNDPSRFRDGRLFIVACDDTYAPQQYFGFFRFTRVHIHVVPTMDGTSVAEAVLARLLTYDHDPDDERWMLLDTDHVTQGTHLRGLLKAMHEAERQGIRVALSKPCFELWLLLHHEEETVVFNLPNASAVEQALRAKLGQYNKTNLRHADYPHASVTSACQRAERLDSATHEIPQTNTTRVYKLLHAIVAKSLPSQLPTQLRSLSPDS